MWLEDVSEWPAIVFEQHAQAPILSSGITQ